MTTPAPFDTTKLLSALQPREYDGKECYDWVSSEEGKTSETGRSAELAFVQRDWS